MEVTDALAASAPGALVRISRIADDGARLHDGCLRCQARRLFFEDDAFSDR
jgi:hypothetical protein